MESVLNFLKRFGLGRFAAIAGAVAGAVAVIAAVMLKMGAEPQALLYANLDLKEASQITAALDQGGVKYEVKGDGSTIMVPRDKVASARLMLASKGLPTSGSVGYEIFDNASALGQTDFVQNLNRQRALEGELARTIRSLRGVTSARVHLVMPKHQLFDDLDAASPTASIVVGLAGGNDLTADQVRSIRNLVAGAVPNLKPDRVTVVDETGKMLAAGSPDGDATLDSQAASDRKSQIEDRIRHAVKEMVEGVVGQGKARVQVSADIDLTQLTEQKEIFDPDGQVVRSTTTSAEKSNQADTTNGGATGAAANIPAQTAQNGAVNGQTSNSSDHNEETTNYEISKTTSTKIEAPGALRKISVAVAVDGVTTTGKDGKVTYTPRSADDMKRIEELVRSAVGYDQTRGDQVSVVNVRFAEAAGGAAGTPGAPLAFDFDKNDVMRGTELLILGVVAALMVFFVVRPMLGSAMGGAGEGFGGAAHAGAGGGVTPLLASAAGGAQPLALAGGGDPALLGSDVEHRLDMARIEGQVKASSIKKVADFVDNHPEESISILRSWLHES